ncbi:hypothetical protein T07_7213 [Trichinella nelsoni]|uniref:Uncharacterized protein n=1 Tax=Trichinella nelsoni TaxID=6336 RepID=A0A0V0RIR0_9BILA|nr:hypothetical protein T07_7213 [Trichinella nelsoni]
MADSLCINIGKTFIPVFRKTTRAKAYEIKEIFGLSDSLLKLQDRSEQIIKQQQACPNRSMFTICRDIALKRETKKEKTLLSQAATLKADFHMCQKIVKK